MPEPILVKDFTYELPEDKIAKYPLANRDASKLLVYKDNQISHTNFDQLSNYLPPNATLYFNNTKVIPARMLFTKETGAIIEIFLLNPLSPSPVVQLAMEAKEKSQWSCIIGNLKRWKDETPLTIAKDNFILNAKLINRQAGVVEFMWQPTQLTFAEIITAIGITPLPPYLQRQAEESDRDRYQTIYSQLNGAVAAPTAGLHFTDFVFETLKKKGIERDFLTLHVGAGTFQPIKTENAAEHTMHAEQVVITKGNLLHLLREDKKVISVGTTSLRTLESLYWYGINLLQNPDCDFFVEQETPYKLAHAAQSVSKQKALQAVLQKMESSRLKEITGVTSIYIRPGYRFKIVNGLITNFHQPNSTLILLVAAFVGPMWKKIYEEALANGYRFLSYGDSSLLLPF